MRKIPLRSEIIRNLNANSLARVHGGALPSKFEGCTGTTAAEQPSKVDNCAALIPTVPTSLNMHCA